MYLRDNDEVGWPYIGCVSPVITFTFRRSWWSATFRRSRVFVTRTHPRARRPRRTKRDFRNISGRREELARKEPLVANVRNLALPSFKTGVVARRSEEEKKTISGEKIKRSVRRRDRCPMESNAKRKETDRRETVCTARRTETCREPLQLEITRRNTLKYFGIEGPNETDETGFRFSARNTGFIVIDWGRHWQTG